MLLRICSDLHLEAFIGRRAETLAADFLPHDERDGGAILILAGDISSEQNQLIDFLATAETQFKHVIYVPGNHEAYRHNFSAWNTSIQERFQCLKNTSATTLDQVRWMIIDGVRFVYGTLWGDGGPTLADQARTGYYLNDFKLIRNGSATSFRLFTVQDMIYQFKVTKREIAAILSTPHNGPTVVVTHHLPSRQLVSERFWPRDGSDGANGGFVGDCEDILAGDHAPVLWIHGHTHDTIDTTLWNTRVVCNPAGYRGEWMSKFNTFMKPNKTGSREVAPVFVQI